MNTAAQSIATLVEHQGHTVVQLRLPDGSQAVVLLHGAQLVSWQAPGRGEQLYLSTTTPPRPGQAVRGGVPVIFPQFEQRGPDTQLPRHGLARTRTWAVDALQGGRDHATVTLTLQDDADTRALWPHSFALELTVSLAPQRIDIELHVQNTGTSTWPFAAALHTYLALSELGLARLQGLDGCRYLDAVTGGEQIEDHPEKRFAGEIDRIYAATPRQLLLRDGPRRLLIESEGFEDTVVWNPGPDKCKALSDMPDDDWMRMLCVEAGQILQPPTLAPGESWTGRQGLVLPD